MREMSGNRNNAAGFGVLLLLLLVNAPLSFGNIRREVGNNEQVTHSHEVLAELQAVLSTMQDAETGQRAYVITGQENYARTLQPRSDAHRGPSPAAADAGGRALGAALRAGSRTAG